MLSLTPAILASLLITVCFSFLNLCLVLIINKVKNLLRTVGLSFSVPFFLCIFALFFPSVIDPAEMLVYADMSLIGIIFILVLFHTRQRFYSCFALISVLLLLFLPASRYGHSLSSFPFFAFWPLAAVSLLTLTIFGVLGKSHGTVNQKLVFGLVLLGAGQICQLIPFPPAVLLGVTIKFLGFLSLSLFITGKIEKALTAKLSEAESKLADLDRIVNMEVRKKIIPLEQHNEHLQNMVMIDTLTGAFNKKFILNTLEKMIEVSDNKEFAVLMFDLDNFKHFNDTRGHMAGDAVLKKIAVIAQTSIRVLDSLGRYGGDEFVIILPGITLSEAMFVAERFRKKVEDANLDLSVSIGIASYPEDGKTPEELLAAADAGLYSSKKQGKNTISHYKDNIKI